MPIYEFRCEKDSCEKEFEEICSYDDVENKKIKCPSCNSAENVIKLISQVKLSFANPAESSRSDNFEYMAKHNMEKAKSERRHAETASHMGPDPHVDINDIESMGEGVFHRGEDYSDDTKL